MKVTDLIKAFASREDLPIDVNDVLGCLRENGSHEDEIEFIGVDLDPNILQGAIKVFHVRNGVYADPVRMVNIYYHRGHEVDWQRLICCKELIHLLDSPSAQTSTPEAIDELASRIGLPPEMQDPIADGVEANVDRLAEWRAAAVLLPMSAREVLLPKLKEGSLKTADIARMADIPNKYAGFVMSDVWPTVYELLIR